MRSLHPVTHQLGLTSDDVLPFGHDKAKVDLGVLERPRQRPAPPRLVLVSAITPTPAGEGKTTTSIGLADALRHLGESVCLALREPSLGPCFGVKGGGTGGGLARLTPSNDINLHFTGDFHALSAAHNLIAALIDNHLHFNSDLDIEPRRVLWPRVLDVNDRALRRVVVGLGGTSHSVPREGSFDITAASELMAMVCLAEGPADLRRRIDRTLVAFDRSRQPIFASQLEATGAVMALLRDALMPNLVQTMEGTPALVHGGPFANIAHGCNSVLATRMALHLADWTVTEAGFGFDLGAEKFFDIKCRSAGLDAAAVVLVATARALKMHGGLDKKQLDREDVTALRAGLPNLAKHIENIRHFNKVPIVAVNRFPKDTDAELAAIHDFCAAQGVPSATADHFRRGGEGALDLARLVVEHARHDAPPFTPLYHLEATIPEKIRAVAQEIYGADDIAFTKAAHRDLRDIERYGYGMLPVCIAKTQNSLSDDPKLRGRPRDFQITVTRLYINSGAGFIVVLTGDILRMPGLPRVPQALQIDVVGGRIVGLR